MKISLAELLLLIIAIGMVVLILWGTNSI